MGTVIDAVRVSVVRTENQFSYFYVKPWNRMGPYVIGLMAGYVLSRCECKLRINKFLNLFLWLSAAGTAMGVLYGLFHASKGHPLTVEVAAFYSAVHRTVWGACVAWVVIACCTGNGGFVDTVLSWSGLVPLSRLTYCIYLLHIMVMDLYMMNQQSLFYMSDINIMTTTTTDDHNNNIGPQQQQMTTTTDDHNNNR
ncbi:hypothetical protein ACOMHN_027513 [Nucella lapillus]